MRINGIHGVNQAYSKNRARKVNNTQSLSSGKDTFVKSSFAAELSAAQAAVSQAPDVRQAKVDEIKKQMEAGTYNITAAQVADKILGKL